MNKWCIVVLLAACGDSKPLEVPERPTFVEPGPPPHTASFTHRVGGHALAAGEETLTCLSWTLDNEAPLYVNAVTFANLGSFHHSNWFVVPEDVYDGPDGVWPCGDRGFEEISAALSGTVLFAQSTQAWNETQQLREGDVVRIPERSKIVANLHLLNLSPAPRRTQAWLTLDLVHPVLVTQVLQPMMFSYVDLRIAANARSRFAATCGGELGSSYELHYALPHYHSTGDFFEIAHVPANGEAEPLLTVEGFGADPQGVVFDPPIRVEPSGGLRVTCGYNNWHSEDLRWGIGINEMCVMFGLVSGGSIITGVADDETELIDVVDGVREHEAPCHLLSSPAGGPYAAPRISELSAPLYVPPVDPDDAGVPPVPECVDADASAAPAVEPTLANLRRFIFEPWCTFSACHGDAAAAGLDLLAEDLSAALAPTIMPGDPEGSRLYQVLSRCTPTNAAGNPTAHMPRNAPVLLDDGLVASVRAFIENQQ